jgi:hypothetical protein
LGCGAARVKTAGDGKYRGLGLTFDHWAAQKEQEGGEKVFYF